MAKKKIGQVLETPSPTYVLAEAIANLRATMPHADLQRTIELVKSGLGYGLPVRAKLDDEWVIVLVLLPGSIAKIVGNDGVIFTVARNRLRTVDGKPQFTP